MGRGSSFGANPLEQTIGVGRAKGDPGGHNQRFCEQLEQALGSNWDRKLTRAVDPAGSLANALTHFVESIGQVTGGRISRLAWFVDEFQDIFAFGQEDVNRVMWALRPLVQNSRNVSLILAGSGLTRRLIADYDQALFGSIQQIPLLPFSLDRERGAIAEALVREWRSGELTQKEFARRKGIAPTTLSWWSCRVGREGRGRARFVPVRVVGGGTRTFGSSWATGGRCACPRPSTRRSLGT